MNISTGINIKGKDGEQLTFSVGGMDCGSCAAKIETALSRLPGVADVKVSVARERLNLSLAESKTSVEKIEDTLRKLGFKPALLPQEKVSRAKVEADHHGHGHWLRSRHRKTFEELAYPQDFNRLCRGLQKHSAAAGHLLLVYRRPLRPAASARQHRIAVWLLSQQPRAVHAARRMG